MVLTMQYACLIYVDQAHQETTPEVSAQYYALSDDAVKHNVLRGGERLGNVDAATTVRVRDGKKTITDGPFAETKEVLGGFFLFECPSLDEALDWAARIPAANWGSIEVRPIIPTRE